MENYNNLMKTDVITQLCQENIDNCCYRRANTFTTEPLQKELRTFPDHGAQQIGHSTSQEDENEKNASQLEDKLEENDLDKLKILLDYEDAPEHLQFNPYIRSGYRTFLPTKLCFQSIFWWTNETVNIWSHIFGLLLFVALSIHDLKFLSMHAATTDKVIVGCLLICFQICMLLSSIYHIFSCRSAEDYDSFLNYDLFGIALSLLAIYISGVYYAFWCHDGLRYFYTFTVIAIFIFALVLQMPRLNVSSNAKIIIFVAWALYGFIPTIHWTFEMGGFQHPIVRLLIPRVIIMYLISGLAFLIYWAKIPERWFAGKLDYCGHSHNWWHIFVLAALYHWHDTGIAYAEFRLNNNCSILRSI